MCRNRTASCRSGFQVWESFDHSQINEHGYEEGEPDGTTGQVYSNCMSPEPEEEWLCDVITTDEEGKAFHKDIRNYNYSKTYCMGHPAPEWIECDHEGDGGDGEDGEGEEEECNCEEEMNVSGSSGLRNRNCVKLPAISMYPMRMKRTMNRVQKQWKPC